MVSTSIRCDRCGFYEVPTCFKVQILTPSNLSKPEERNNIFYERNLCLDCGEDLREWMRKQVT